MFDFSFSFTNNLWIFLFLSWGIINAFWCIQMQKSLLLVVPNNKMKPENAWLTYIPLFGLAWQFIVTKAVGDSLGEEYERRGIIARESRPGNSVGLTANILLCCAVIPTFGILIALVSNISRIIHIVKVKNASEQLENIMQTQMQYSSSPPPVYQPETNPFEEEELKKNNPERFKPPQTEEEDYERWRKK